MGNISKGSTIAGWRSMIVGLIYRSSITGGLDAKYARRRTGLVIILDQGWRVFGLTSFMLDNPSPTRSIIYQVPSARQGNGAVVPKT